MTAHDAFWERVNESLDARRDPLDVPEVQRLLTEDPGRLGELEALRVGLGLLARSRRRRLAARAAAALLVAGLGLAGARSLLRFAAGAPPAEGTDLTAAAPPATPAAPAAAAAATGPDAVHQPAPSRVLAFHAEVTVEGPRGRQTTSFDGLRTRVRTESRGPGTPLHPQTPVFVATASSAALSR